MVKESLRTSGVKTSLYNLLPLLCSAHNGKIQFDKQWSQKCDGMNTFCEKKYFLDIFKSYI